MPKTRSVALEHGDRDAAAGELAAAAALCAGAPVPAVLLVMPDLEEAARSRSFAPLARRLGDEGLRRLRDLAREAVAQGRAEFELPGQAGHGTATPLQDAGGDLLGVMLWLGGGVGSLEVEQAVAAKSRFLAAASHDLRQPFQAMRLFLGVLSSQIKEETPRRTAQMLGQALTSGESLLNSLLDISTLEAGTVQARRRPFAVDDLCRRLADEMAPLAAEKGLEMRTRIRRAEVDSDPVLVERILRNLISNAIRYTRQGKVLVAARPRRHDVLVQVWDTGFGIPDEQKALIFEEFHQLENPERDRSRGLGLGLAIVRRISRLIDAPVDLRSELGRGSVFSVVLPYAEAERRAEPAARAAEPSGASLAGHTLLVVDDEPLVLESLRVTLESWGCRVSAAADMAGVLQALDEEEPEAILSDLRLPKNLSGFDVIDRVRAILGKPLPAVVLTGETGKEALGEGKRRGLLYLHKPVQSEELRRAVETCFRK